MTGMITAFFLITTVTSLTVECSPIAITSMLPGVDSMEAEFMADNEGASLAANTDLLRLMPTAVLTQAPSAALIMEA
jgi:hypothetical protein